MRHATLSLMVCFPSLTPRSASRTARVPFISLNFEPEACSHTLVASLGKERREEGMKRQRRGRNTYRERHVFVYFVKRVLEMIGFIVSEEEEMIGAVNGPQLESET